ncbi:MAG: hypothetical protein ACKVK8_05510 [Rhodospirillales bacterium]|jgi:carbon-monoxide dehydrogenase large subunit
MNAMDIGVSYDTDGQLLSGSYIDYCISLIDSLTSFEEGNAVKRCAHNNFGSKSCGEVGAPLVVTNIIVDGLSPLGVSGMLMPAISSIVLEAI